MAGTLFIEQPHALEYVAGKFIPVLRESLELTEVNTQGTYVSVERFHVFRYLSRPSYTIIDKNAGNACGPLRINLLCQIQFVVLMRN